MSASERVAVGAALPGDLASRIDRAFGLALEIGTALLVAPRSSSCSSASSRATRSTVR